MLTLPANSSPFKVLSFDPGSKNLGTAVLEYMLDDSNKVVKKSETFTLKENCPAYSETAEIHGSRVARLLIMKDIVTNILRTEKPNAVIVESNYLGKFANSFAALTECVAIIRACLYEYDPFIPLYMVDPSTVKINAGLAKVKGTDKEDVRRALLSRKDLSWEINPQLLDEHSIDACAIGYYYFTEMV